MPGSGGPLPTTPLLALSGELALLFLLLGESLPLGALVALKAAPCVVMVAAVLMARPGRTRLLPTSPVMSALASRP